MKNDDELNQILRSANTEISSDKKYKHYKGGVYKVICVALLESTLAPCVVYQAQYGKKLVFIRSVKEWNEIVEFNGESLPRFSIVE